MINYLFTGKSRWGSNLQNTVDEEGIQSVIRVYFIAL